MSDPPSQGGIRCMLMRGGTSKGAYFLADDLPGDPGERDDLLLRVMGSPDPRQIDGLGGAHPLTSKVAIVSPSATPGVDIDYLFLQVVVDQPVVSDAQTCGNLLAGVGPFAVERGLVAAQPERPTRPHPPPQHRQHRDQPPSRLPTAAAVRRGHLDRRRPRHGRADRHRRCGPGEHACCRPATSPTDRRASGDLIDNGMPVVVVAASSASRATSPPTTSRGTPS